MGRGAATRHDVRQRPPARLNGKRYSGRCHHVELLRGSGSAKPLSVASLLRHGAAIRLIWGLWPARASPLIHTGRIGPPYCRGTGAVRAICTSQPVTSCATCVYHCGTNAIIADMNLRNVVSAFRGARSDHTNLLPCQSCRSRRGRISSARATASRSSSATTSCPLRMHPSRRL